MYESWGYRIIASRGPQTACLRQGSITRESVCAILSQRIAVLEMVVVVVSTN